MTLQFFCPHWGSEHMNFNDFLLRVKDAGYDGVECSIPLDKKAQEPMLDGFAKHGLLWIAQHWETVSPDWAAHQQEFERRLRSLAAGKPLFINTQTGKDHFSFDQNAHLIETADGVAEDTGVRIVHETHRGKFSFAAHVMHGYLQKLPRLRITLDVSHWFTVAETFLHDQRDAVQLALRRTDHIHARIGFTEGPQVSDPRAPEWEETVAHHLRLWDDILRLKKKAASKTMTLTPEYGAPPYQPLHPYTQKPLAEQWDVNVYMMNMLRERYNNPAFFS